MVISKSSITFKFLIYIFVFGLILYCKPNSVQHVNQNPNVRNGVQLLINNTEASLSAKGPIAWLDYFENSSGFYMASDGAIAFPNYKAADIFIKGTLVKQLKTINLKLTDIRIDVISSGYATVGANFHEDLIDFAGKAVAFNGYFTATVHYIADGWKYRNLHWSIKK